MIESIETTPAPLSNLDKLKAEVVPESRQLSIFTPRNAVWRGSEIGYCVPIYCASCSAPGGLVPQENMTFAFYLCNECFKLYGHLTTMMVMPDEQFWEMLKQEQLDQYGRLLTNEELITIVEADASPLATLIKQGRLL